jgi:zinc transporter 1/2/3
MIGVSLPLLTRSVPALQPDQDLFVIVKSFAAGIILATGFMHVLPDSFEMLRSNCLNENPWHKFPFSGFVAMLSAIVTLMVDSMATSMYTRKNCDNAGKIPDQEMAMVTVHHHGPKPELNGDSQLLRYRVVAMVTIFRLQINYL